MNTVSRNTMMIVVALAMLFAGVRSISAQEKKHFTMKDIPAEVKASFEKTYPHAVMKGAGKEVENGETMYEIESVDGSVHRDILFKKDGTVYEVEEGMTSSLLPAAVSAGIHKSFPKYTINKAEKTMHGQEISYEVIVKRGKKKYEVTLNPDGKIVEKKQIREKKEKEGEKEGDEEDED